MEQENSTDKPKFQLLVFCDASKYAYAAAVYLRQEAKDRCMNRLVFSKARLAPNKELSIPRLELLAALIGVKCMKFVENELKLEIEQKHMWINSKCVLKWIGSNRTFTIFVENRLNEIRKDRDIVYHYIPSSENPADFPSRRLDTEEQRDNHRWWYRPEWVLSPSDSRPTLELKRNENDTELQGEYRTKNAIYEAKLVAGESLMDKQGTTKRVSAPLDIDIRRFSSLTKLLRITVLALRFIDKLKKASRSTGQIDSEDIIQAETLWTRYVQALHYDDVIRAIQENRRNNIKHTSMSWKARKCGFNPGSQITNAATKGSKIHTIDS